MRDLPAGPLSATEVVRSRRSVRAFLDRPVSRTLVSEILDAAARAPSGSNIQPWKVHVVTGAERAALTAELTVLHDAGVPPDPEYAYYPAHWREPYLGRRRKVGWSLYGALGIARGDRDRMARQHGRNYDFFGAPVGLFFCLDREMERGSWLDLGMFMQNVMIVARGVGLDTCPQQAFCNYHRIVRKRLGIPDEEILVSGMALGYADPAAPENRFATDREPVDGFARFVGF